MSFPQKQTKKCPFCAEEILVDARKCKHCGSSLVDKPVVIERTSKKYKKQMVMSLMIFVAGFFMGAFQNSITDTVGGFMIVIGLIAFVTSVVEAWWHHG